MNHDPLCYVAMNGGNCCPWLPACDCQCMCEYIKEVRDDTIASLTALQWYSKARWTGYHDGLNAAEAAVAELKYAQVLDVGPAYWNHGLVKAVAAIRALKEKP